MVQRLEHVPRDLERWRPSRRQSCCRSCRYPVSVPASNPTSTYRGPRLHHMCHLPSSSTTWSPKCRAKSEGTRRKEEGIWGAEAVGWKAGYWTRSERRDEKGLTAKFWDHFGASGDETQTHIPSITVYIPTNMTMHHSFRLHFPTCLESQTQSMRSSIIQVSKSSLFLPFIPFDPSLRKQTFVNRKHINLSPSAKPVSMKGTPKVAFQNTD